MPGQVIVIHPDELHDGGAGTDHGLRYRMIYIPPEQIGEALLEEGGGRLPFVRAPVLSDGRFQQSLAEALEDINLEMGDLKRSTLLAELSACLSKHTGATSRTSSTLNKPALKICADFLKECSDETVRMRVLEELSGMDRFSLSRQFKALFGTSPHRYLIMRRLEKVKQMLSWNRSLAEAATESGFADQSHMNRHFKRAFGMTPGHWRRLCAANGT